MSDGAATPGGFAGRLSARASALQHPATMAMVLKARELSQAGRDIVDLTIGEPDFDTPRAIRDAAWRALEAGQTKYGPVAGTLELREAIADKLARDSGLDYAADEISVANGAKQALMNAFLTLLDPGDEVVLIAPYWAAYPGMAAFAGATPVIVETDVAQGFKPTPKQLAAALTKRTRLVLFNSPSNPSGAVFTRAEMEALLQVVLKHPRLFILSDEIYEHILFDGEHVSFAALAGARERTVTVNGLSKSHAMTGWRIGYAAAPRPIAAALAKVQGVLSGGANPFVQAAAAHALTHCASETQAMCAAYRRRRDRAMPLLAALPGVAVEPPRGAFYAFPDVSAHFGKQGGGKPIDGSAAFADYLLENAGVSTVPGIGFGDDRCIRLSLAASDERIVEGIARLGVAIAALT